MRGAIQQLCNTYTLDKTYFAQVKSATAIKISFLKHCLCQAPNVVNILLFKLKDMQGKF